MAKVRQRTWRVPGQRTKRKAWGFVTVENGKQVRCWKSEWTREDAENALAARSESELALSRERLARLQSDRAGLDAFAEAGAAIEGADEEWIDEEAGELDYRLRELCKPILRLGRAALDSLAAIPYTPKLVNADRAFVADLSLF